MWPAYDNFIRKNSDEPKKKENENSRFRYHMTMEQMREHQKRTPEEILHWIEEYAAFLQAFQTAEDKAITRKLKNKQTWLDEI